MKHRPQFYFLLILTVIGLAVGIWWRMSYPEKGYTPTKIKPLDTVYVTWVDGASPYLEFSKDTLPLDFIVKGNIPDPIYDNGDITKAIEK